MTVQLLRQRRHHLLQRLLLGLCLGVCRALRRQLFALRVQRRLQVVDARLQCKRTDFELHQMIHFALVLQSDTSQRQGSANAQ